MPEKLVFIALEFVMEWLNLSENKALSEENIEDITRLLSKKMNVSFQAMSYRLKKLEVFVDIE